MKHVLMALMTIGMLVAVACGGPAKPPMTPDPDTSGSPDGGTEGTPAPSK